MQKRARESFDELAPDVIERLSSFGDASILGSYGRGAQSVGDLDILLVSETEVDVARLFPEFRVNRPSARRVVLLTRDGPVDVWQSRPSGREAANIYLSGPTPRNVGMRKLARAVGLRLDFDGLWDDGRLLSVGPELVRRLEDMGCIL